MAYSKEEIESTFEKVLILIEKGKALRTILFDEDMPSSQTFYKWLDEDDIKSKQYARATKVRADKIFEDILDIADFGDNDKTIKIGSDGVPKEVTDYEVIQRSRLRVDARKWYLSKLNPKKYGDKIETTLEGGENPIKTTVINLGNGIKPDEAT